MGEKRFNVEREKGFPAAVYLFHGVSFLVEEASAEVFGHFFPEGLDDFNCTVFHATTDRAEDIVNTAGTLPFMAPRRVVLVKEAGAFKAADKKVFEHYLGNPSPQTCLVFITGTFDKRSAFLKLLMDSGCISLQFSVPETQVPLWVRQRAANLGIRLSADAERLLLDLVGPDVALIVKELEKLSLVGPKEVGVAEVESAVGHVREYTPFAIVEAIRKRNAERALRIMKALRESGQDAVSLLGIIGWHYRQVLKREGQTRGGAEIFEALHRADVELKTTGKPDWIVLETLLFRLIGA